MYDCNRPLAPTYTRTKNVAVWCMMFIDCLETRHGHEHGGIDMDMDINLDMEMIMDTYIAMDIRHGHKRKEWTRIWTL
jgi:hypothetical protein